MHLQTRIFLSLCWLLFWSFWAVVPVLFACADEPRGNFSWGRCLLALGIYVIVGFGPMALVSLWRTRKQEPHKNK